MKVKFDINLTRVSLPIFFTLFYVIYIVIDGANGLDNRVGRTPLMGWNSWNRVI